jgi:rhodanese-related sulfurtransferase
MGRTAPAMFHLTALDSVTSMDVAEISVNELAQLMADGSAVLIDVRETDEYQAGHVPGALLVPLGTVPVQVEVFTGEPTYVICRSGARSMRACEFLAEEGRPVVNVAGGTLAWIEAGFEVETGNS